MDSIKILLSCFVIGTFVLVAYYAFARCQAKPSMEALATPPDINFSHSAGLMFQQTQLLSPQEYWSIITTVKKEDIYSLEAEGIVTITDANLVIFVKRGKALRTVLTRLKKERSRRIAAKEKRAKELGLVK